MRFILASASPRRAELLRAAGYSFEVVVTDVDESMRPGEPPAAYVRRLAAEKSAAAQSAFAGSGFSRNNVGPPEGGPHKDVGPPQGGPHKKGTYVGPPQGGPHKGTYVGPPEGDEVVLGADTTVVVDGEILGKPRDEADGRSMLRRLSGRAHEVLTGVSLRRDADEVSRVEITVVTFRPLTDEDISWYVASGEGLDKAGGYAIQGLASRFIPSIAGSYSNVVGLPVACIDELLRSLLASGR